VRPVSSFIVRVTGGAGRAVSGTVERVKTGERHRFEGLEALVGIFEHALGAAPGPGRADEVGPSNLPRNEEVVP
jgi:hypothetical protein